jgi:choloylglycine hydrolase
MLKEGRKMKKGAVYFLILILNLVLISSMTYSADIVINHQDISETSGISYDVNNQSSQSNATIENPVQGCSSFFLSNPISSVFGTNCDYFVFTSGQVFVNKRNMVKTGLETGTTGKRAEWTSKFGSLTFNFVGYQMAWGGMNEAGLIISTMYLPETKTPVPDQRPPLNAGFWVQYQLDNYATVAEVIASDSCVRIKTTDHYLVCDKNGNCAVIEFMDRKMVYHTGRDLPVNVLTNGRQSLRD